MWLDYKAKVFDGLAWHVDGDNGPMDYPGTWTAETVKEYYRNGWGYAGG